MDLTDLTYIIFFSILWTYRGTYTAQKIRPDRYRSHTTPLFPYQQTREYFLHSLSLCETDYFQSVFLCNLHSVHHATPKYCRSVIVQAKSIWSQQALEILVLLTFVEIKIEFRRAPGYFLTQLYFCSSQSQFCCSRSLKLKLICFTLFQILKGS